MGRESNVTHGTTQDGDKVGFRVSKSDEGSTRTYHGYENGPHYTEHQDGSRWRTDSNGDKRQVEDSSNGNSGK